MIIIRKRAYARAGLVGNPSDGYHGKTISISVRNFWAEVVLYEWDSVDIVLAEDVRKTREKVGVTFAEIEKVAKEQSLDAVPHVLAVASLLKQIYEHSVDIADLVMPKRE